MNLNIIRQQINSKTDDLIELTEDTLSLNCTLEECFPVVQYAHFEIDGKKYRMKMEYTVKELEND